MRADWIPAGMEAFVATNDEQFSVIKKVIDLCDYYILIIGKRYGSINESTGISYTEMEYDYAVSKDIPILAFILRENVDLQASKTETNPKSVAKLQNFRKKAKSNRLVSFWESTEDLVGKVATSIIKAKEDTTRPGWVRGGEYDPIATASKINDLYEENKKLLEEKNKLEAQLNSLAFVEKSDLAFNEDIVIKYEDYDVDPWEENASPLGYVVKEKSISFRKMFGYISLCMTEPLSEVVVFKLIIKYLGLQKESQLIDDSFLYITCNQYVALGLMECERWGSDGRYYYLTEYGIKMRDEITLFKKERKNSK